MPYLLDLGAAVFALLAALFWFLSAQREIPDMKSYYGKIPPDDPFQLALKFSAVMNRYAAGFSGLSALCVAAKIFW